MVVKGSMSAKDPYQVLEVRPGALEELVTEAYWHHVYRLQQELRTDPTVARQVEELNQAYEAVISEYALAAEGRDGAPAPVPSMETAEETIWQNPRDYYAILHVDRDATPDLVALAYEILRARFSRRKPIQAAILKKIEEAYTVLSTPALRASYDAGQLPLPEDEEQEDVLPEDVVDRVYRNVFAPLGEGLGRIWLAALDFGQRLAQVALPLGRPIAAVILYPARLAGEALQRRNLRVPLPSLPLPRLARRSARLPWPAPSNGAQGTTEPAGQEALIVHGPAWLEVRDRLGGRLVALAQAPITIGSDPQCEVVLPGEAVAPAHARIWYRDGRYLFHRLDRPREVKVCGRPLDWAVLESGDVIQIGPHELVFQERG